jgi:hypothetical protein
MPALLTGVPNYDAAKYLTGKKALDKFYRRIFVIVSGPKQLGFFQFGNREW